MPQSGVKDIYLLRRECGSPPRWHDDRFFPSGPFCTKRSLADLIGASDRCEGGVKDIPSFAENAAARRDGVMAVFFLATHLHRKILG